ncbi:MAG: signal peptide peptidase SppA [Bacteroidales bacterium]
MKSFFSAFLGSCLGFLAGLFFLLVLFGAFVQGFMLLSGNQKPVAEKSVLEMNLNISISEQTTFDPLSSFDILSLSALPSVGLDRILSSIEAAADDPHIEGIWLHTEQMSAGMATVNAIRNALIAFKKSGKFIVSYADSYDQKAYYLATVSDHIFMPPTGSLSWRGLSIQTLYFKKLLDRFSIDLQPVRHGKYKSAVEPYMLDEMSLENREQYSSLLTTLWGHMSDSVASARNLTRDQLESWAGEQLLRDERKAYELGMIDSLIYLDQAEEIMALAAGSDNECSTISLTHYMESLAVHSSVVSGKPAVAVVYASGDMVSGSARAGEMGVETIRESLREAIKDQDVKSIVLRINSPGGSALAAEMLWREVSRAASNKPLVVSMGDYAASGGYYMALPAREIWADPFTLTGSIGVFGLYPCLETFLDQKIGVTPQSVTTHPSADAGSLYRKMTPLEREWAEESVDRVYETFLGHVIENRGIGHERADSLAEGRVWSGADALSLGLIDSLGGLDKTIARAATLANLTDYGVKSWPKERGLFETLLSDVGFAVKSRFSVSNPLSQIEIPAIKRVLRGGAGIQMRMAEGFEPVERLGFE